MRRYEEGQERTLHSMTCNLCGRRIPVQNGMVKEGVFSADAAMGYFSRQDGVTYHFDLCEDCLEQLMAQFTIPADCTENTELL